jgi:hypothetical protein
MTKRDYVRIADALVEGFARAGISYSQEDDIMREFCRELLADNPRFDCNKFRAYIERFTTKRRGIGGSLAGMFGGSS